MEGRILFVTGQLAEYSLRRVLLELHEQIGLRYDVTVLRIRVAALMSVDWLIKKLEIPEGFDRVVIPGWCRGDMSQLCEHFGRTIEKGPKDLLDLPEYFGHSQRSKPNLQEYDIEIIAEINHAPELSDEEVVDLAESYADDGADVIDLGCIPGQPSPRIGDLTARLCDRGLRVSVDSFDRHEVESAVASGAELVLSCNSSNREWAARLKAELVVIPDNGDGTSSFHETVAFLEEQNTRYRLDPVLEPIGFGFAASLMRYWETRQEWPEARMMMGVGNLTELTEVDSAGINLLLTAICQELNVTSVLTTQVINWSRSCVRELEIARRLVRHSTRCNTLPKHIDAGLVLLRDSRLRSMGADVLQHLRQQLKDRNFRIFVERGEIHMMNRDGYWHGVEPYELMKHVRKDVEAIDSSHAFYLGCELTKAKTALTLGKQYTQDEPLDWGFLTELESTQMRCRRQLDS